MDRQKDQNVNKDNIFFQISQLSPFKVGCDVCLDVFLLIFPQRFSYPGNKLCSREALSCPASGHELRKELLNVSAAKSSRINLGLLLKHLKSRQLNNSGVFFSMFWKE